MFCTRCGVALSDSTVNFCAQCGAPTAHNTASASQPYPRLSRPRDDRKIAGVCAGFARYLGMDVTLVRLIAVVLIFWPPCVGLIAYIVSWAVIPNEQVPMPQPAPVHSEPANGHA